MQMKMMVMITVLAPLSLFRNTTPIPSVKLLRLRTSLAEIFFSCFFSLMTKIVWTRAANMKAAEVAMTPTRPRNWVANIVSVLGARY